MGQGFKPGWMNGTRGEIPGPIEGSPEDERVSFLLWGEPGRACRGGRRGLPGVFLARLDASRQRKRGCTGAEGAAGRGALLSKRFRSQRKAPSVQVQPANGPHSPAVLALTRRSAGNHRAVEDQRLALLLPMTRRTTHVSRTAPITAITMLMISPCSPIPPKPR